MPRRQASAADLAAVGASLGQLGLVGAWAIGSLALGVVTLHRRDP